MKRPSITRIEVNVRMGFVEKKRLHKVGRVLDMRGVRMVTLYYVEIVKE